MKVEIALYATLSQYLPPGAQNRRAVLEVKDGATVRDVMTQVGIPSDLPNILLVNGRQAPESTVLKDGETLSIFPPLAGGSAAAGPFLAKYRSRSKPYTSQPYQDSEKPVFAQAAQKGPDARRRTGYPSGGWVQVRDVLSPYVAAARECANAADGPFSAAC